MSPAKPPPEGDETTPAKLPREGDEPPKYEYLRSRRLERLRVFTSLIIAVAGLMLGATILYSFVQERRASQVSNEALYIEMRRLQERLDLLQYRLDQLEKRLPGKTNIDLRAAEPTPSEAGQPAKNAEASKRNVVLRDYIVPSIYVTLGVLLVISALVTLGARDPGRKDAAMEITKTLMTFFIGAATGQA